MQQLIRQLCPVKLQLCHKDSRNFKSKVVGLSIPLFATSLGGCSSDIGKDPGFGGGFGFFTYGVPTGSA